MNTPRLQDDLDNLVLWTNDWSIELYLSNCKVMNFGKKNKKYSYTMLDTDLNRRSLAESNLERNLVY